MERDSQMTFRLALLAGVLLVPVGALAQEAAPPADIKALAQSCDAHKFETAIDVPSPDGGTHRSKVRICGQEGQSDADWVRTLKDTIAKVSANEKMPAAVRQQLMTAISGEIARVEESSTTLAGSDLLAIPAPIAKTPAAPVAAPPERGVYAPPEYSVYQPLAPPKPVETASLSAKPSKPVPRLSAPRLSFRCQDTNSMAGEGPCDALTRDTLLTVKAAEDVPGGTSLRFKRRSDDRGEVDLALKRGQSARMPLPEDVCRGVTWSRVTIEVVRRAPGVPAEGQVVDSKGPFELTC